MKTTIELPDDLFIAAKRRAAEDRTTLRELMEQGLRHQLGARKPAGKRAAIKWVVAKGGLPRGLDVANRESLHDFLGARK